VAIRTSSEPQEVFLLEAFGTKGIQVSRFSEKKRFLGSHYRRMALRKLTWAGKSDKMQTINTMCRDFENLSLSNFFKGSGNSAHRSVST